MRKMHFFKKFKHTNKIFKYTAFLAIFKRLRQAQAPNIRLRHQTAGSGTSRHVPEQAQAQHNPAQPAHTGTYRLRPAQYRPRPAQALKYYFYINI